MAGLIDKLKVHVDENIKPQVDIFYPLPSESNRYSQLIRRDYNLTTPIVKKALEEKILPAIHYMLGGKGWRTFFAQKLAESFDTELEEEFIAASFSDQSASLAFDDIGDNFKGLSLNPNVKRRGKEAAYIKFGPALIDAVSLFMFYRNDVLATCREPPKSLQEQRAIDYTENKADLCLGQALDIAFREMSSDIYEVITLKDHETMCLLKTGAMICKDIEYAQDSILMEYAEDWLNWEACESISFFQQCREFNDNVDMYVKIRNLDVHKLSDNLALFYQYIDDIKGVSSTSELGKNDYDDLYNRSLARPIIHLLNDADKKDKKTFIELFGKEGKEDKDLQDITSLITKYESVDKTRKEVEELKGSIFDMIDSIKDTLFYETINSFVEEFSKAL